MRETRLARPARLSPSAEWLFKERLDQPLKYLSASPGLFGMLKRWFQRTVLSRRWLTFLVMGFAFFVFGVGTFNIFMVLSSNLELIAGYGWQALTDGAGRQFVELVVTGYLSMAAYIIFKACELRLAHELASGKSAHENRVGVNPDPPSGINPTR